MSKKNRKAQQQSQKKNRKAQHNHKKKTAKNLKPKMNN